MGVWAGQGWNVFSYNFSWAYLFGVVQTLIVKWHNFVKVQLEYIADLKPTICRINYAEWMRNLSVCIQLSYFRTNEDFLAVPGHSRIQWIWHLQHHMPPLKLGQMWHFVYTPKPLWKKEKSLPSFLQQILSKRFIMELSWKCHIKNLHRQ